MLGKILGAVVGAKAAQHARGIDGPAGAIIGAGAVALARRMGPMGLVAAALGGYALKRYNEKRGPAVQPGASGYPGERR